MRRSKKEGRNVKEERVYASMEEFEEIFYPNYFKKRSAESMDSHTLAINLAEESLQEIKRQLVK